MPRYHPASMCNTIFLLSICFAEKLTLGVLVYFWLTMCCLMQKENNLCDYVHQLQTTIEMHKKLKPGYN